jgi:hypothetical protein
MRRKNTPTAKWAIAFRCFEERTIMPGSAHLLSIIAASTSRAYRARRPARDMVRLQQRRAARLPQFPPEYVRPQLTVGGAPPLAHREHRAETGSAGRSTRGAEALRAASPSVMRAMPLLKPSHRSIGARKRLVCRRREQTQVVRHQQIMAESGAAREGP